jgi:hypothetical protein
MQRWWELKLKDGFVLKRRNRDYILFVHNLHRNGRYCDNSFFSDDLPVISVNKRQLCNDVMHWAYHCEGLRRARRLRRPRRRRGRRARGDLRAQRLVTANSYE